MRMNRKIVPAALLVAAFSLAGTAQGAPQNFCGIPGDAKADAKAAAQLPVQACAVPATSNLTLVALALFLAAAGAVLLDRRKNP